MSSRKYVKSSSISSRNTLYTTYFEKRRIISWNRFIRPPRFSFFFLRQRLSLDPWILGSTTLPMNNNFTRCKSDSRHDGWRDLNENHAKQVGASGKKQTASQRGGSSNERPQKGRTGSRIGPKDVVENDPAKYPRTDRRLFADINIGEATRRELSAWLN